MMSQIVCGLWNLDGVDQHKCYPIPEMDNCIDLVWNALMCFTSNARCGYWRVGIGHADGKKNLIPLPSMSMEILWSAIWTLQWPLGVLKNHGRHFITSYMAVRFGIIRRHRHLYANCKREHEKCCNTLSVLHRRCSIFEAEEMQLPYG